MSQELSPAEFCYSGIASCRPSAAVRMMRLLIFLMAQDAHCQLPDYLDMQGLKQIRDAQTRIEKRINHMTGNHRSALNSFSVVGERTQDSPSSILFEDHLHHEGDDKECPQKIYTFICLFLKMLQQYSQNLREPNQQQVTEKILRKMQRVFLIEPESQHLAENAYQSVPFSPHRSAPSIPEVSLNAEQSANPLCTENTKNLIQALLNSKTLNPYQNDPSSRMIGTSHNDTNNPQGRDGCCCTIL